MAANKFATMLHRNTNKITMILIYAVLEWTLIVLLLLNSLFCYLIIKFAQYFGLKTPCLWCSRVDHIIEPGKNKNMHRDLLCEAHATEISRLGYCSNHQKLAASQHMCDDCLSSRPEFREVSKSFTFFGMIHTDGEKVVDNGGDESLNCSCCGVTFDSNMLPQIVIKPSWDVLEYAKKGELITKVGEDDNNDDHHHLENGHNLDGSRSDFTTDRCEVENGCENKGEIEMVSDVNGGFENKDEIEMVADVNGDFSVIEKEADEDGLVSVSISELKELKGNEVEKVDVVLEEEIVEAKQDKLMKDQAIQVSVIEDASFEILPQHLEFFIDCSGHRLVPVELIDSATEGNQSRDIAKNEEQGSNLRFEVHEKAKTEVVSEEICRGVEEDEEHSAHMNEESQFGGFESMEIEEDENSLVFYAKGCSDREVTITRVARTPSQDSGDVQEQEAEEDEEKLSDVHPVDEDNAQIAINETEAEVSIGTEIPDLDITDEMQTQEVHSSYVCTSEHPSTSSFVSADDDRGFMLVQEYTIELNTLSIEVNGHLNNRSSVCSDLNEIEEDKVPDTPTSIDSLHNLHKKLLLLEKKDSGTEDSLDGSVISELEGGDGVVTIERVKSALRAERKALHALYAELEEERNASAIAANQTMAMINRLQEEKAAMQMEALQYQRMMEEQAEYDQEALQLLNELMVKREKEKEELEKELEIYRKKVLEHETREKLRMLRKSNDGSARSGFSSPSCSNAEDSDAASIDLNQEAKEDDGFYSHRECDNDNTPVNAVLNLEESIADFEEERLSILEQLKVLEEKLMTLDDEDIQHFEDVRPIEHHEENGNHIDENGHFDGLANGHANGFQKEMNGIYHPERRSKGPKGKSLLPLFDAISDENGDIMLNGNESGLDSNGVHKSSLSNFELDNKKPAIEEELDHLYERLQALEADREFLKHCISSLNKGDKGMHLLHEILQHLKDLRNVELRVRNLSDGTLV